MIRLERIGPENWRTGLSVREDQRDFVAAPDRILARAWAYRELSSRAFMITIDGEPTGMALYYDCPELEAYDLSQLFIDERFQGRGYGKKAAELLIETMKKEHRFDRIVLCYKEGNEAAEKMYLDLGFVHTGERDLDEIIMEKQI
ncbi:MAG: GNAT family N-acetyltransferase [Oscillospiraceae bacterium]|nr:GNAT family N-acetyltransferase [Oscillospiraceae bacterium]